MKNWAKQIAALALFSLSMLLRAEDKALTLKDCYELAFKQSETIAINQQRFAETEAQLEASYGAIKPHLDFVSSDKWQDSSSNAGSQFTLPHTPERRFSATQPLFSGFKEFAAMQAAKSQKRQRQFETARAQLLLFDDVSSAFYLVLEERADLDILQDTRKALVDRIQELNGRVKIGKSRTAEVDTAQTQLDRLDAEIEQAKGQEKVAKQLLEFLTGHAVDQLSDPLPALRSLPPLGTYANKAGNRPDVQAAAEAIHVAEKQVKYTKGDYWPNASVQGNYYTQRAGVLTGIDWDALLLVDVPIYKGGGVRANVHGAKARLEETRLEQQLTERNAGREILDDYAVVEAAVNRTIPLERGVQAARRSLQAQVKDYRHGLVNNLDVLQSLQSLQDVQRDFIRAQNEVKRLYWKLQAATGQTL